MAHVGSDLSDNGLRRVVRLVALLNLGYFGVEFTVATSIGSVSLFADSVDFLEDASVNLLILVGLRWAVRSRAKLGIALAGVLLLPGIATYGRPGRSSAYPSRPIRCP